MNSKFSIGQVRVGSIFDAVVRSSTSPLLYMVGAGDPLQRGPDEIFAKAPSHPLNRYVTVDADVLLDIRNYCAMSTTTWLIVGVGHEPKN